MVTKGKTDGTERHRRVRFQILAGEREQRVLFTRSRGEMDLWSQNTLAINRD